ncbi:MAG: hypothetical protein KF773_13230 [Deltaproteobacteria bacterium]|nr:hypothetical protein [Deltaproteobacteria bacterium]
MIRRAATDAGNVADAVPEPIEPRPTARLDASKLDGLIDGSRTASIDHDALEIALEEERAQPPSRPSRLAHTLRREAPANARPTTPMAAPVLSRRDVHTRETLPPPPSTIATGSVSELPVYRPPPAQVSPPPAPSEPVAVEEDSSRPIDVEGVEARVSGRTVPPTRSPVLTHQRILGLVVACVVVAGAGITAAALYVL